MLVTVGVLKGEGAKHFKNLIPHCIIKLSTFINKHALGTPTYLQFTVRSAHHNMGIC